MAKPGPGGCAGPAAPRCYPAPAAGYKYAPVVAPIKRSMSFLSYSDLFSYKIIPAASIVFYIGTSVGTIAHHETLELWFGSEYRAIMIVNVFTGFSFLGHFCYIYGRRHIRHAGAFQKIVYPCFGALAFNGGSHFIWAFIKEMLKEQECFDYHWRILGGVVSGLLFVYTGRSYLKFIDHW